MLFVPLVQLFLDGHGVLKKNNGLFASFRIILLFQNNMSIQDTQKYDGLLPVKTPDTIPQHVEQLLPQLPRVTSLQGFIVDNDVIEYDDTFVDDELDEHRTGNLSIEGLDSTDDEGSVDDGGEYVPNPTEQTLIARNKELEDLITEACEFIELLKEKINQLKANAIVMKKQLDRLEAENTSLKLNRTKLTPK